MRDKKSGDDRPHLIAVNRYYWPDFSATGQLLTDLCEHAASNGFRVTVITSRSGYLAGPDRLRARECRNGVDIRRVWTTYFGRASTPGRIVDYLTFVLSAFGAMLAQARAGDVILAKTDPPLISVPAWIAARLRGAHLVNWLQDIFPEVAEALGIRAVGGPVGTMLRRLRNRSLAGARANIVICDRMAEWARAACPSIGRMRVIQNWADADIRPVKRADNWLRAEWGLSDRFVIGYSGNLGRPHGADRVAELVGRTAGIERVTWLFVGGGSGRAVVERAAAEIGAAVQFRDYQPRAALGESLSVPDLHLVSLDPACEGLLMPSKLYGVMAAGRPVLALGDPDGALAREVRRAGMGLVLDVSTPDRWAKDLAAILDFETVDALGAQARAWLEVNHRPTIRLDTWIKMLMELVLANDQASAPIEKTV